MRQKKMLKKWLIKFDAKKVIESEKDKAMNDVKNTCRTY